MLLLLGALTEGWIFVPLALGLFLGYRVCAVLDLTVDGAFGLGAATVAALLVRGVPPLPATLAGAVAGGATGAVTGLVATRARVPVSLAGVLTTTALYSISLFVMGGGNLSLASSDTLLRQGARWGSRLLGTPDLVALPGGEVSGDALVVLSLTAIVGLALVLALGGFLRSELGLALRAAGGNPRMSRALAVDVDRMLLLGLVLSNGTIGLSGALFAQFLGFANIQIGVGMVVTGLAMLLVGEALAGRTPLRRGMAGILVGAVVFQLVVAAAIRLGLSANALKLVTSGLVLLVLLLPMLVRRLGAWRGGPRHV